MINYGFKPAAQPLLGVSTLVIEPLAANEGASGGKRCQAAVERHATQAENCEAREMLFCQHARGHENAFVLAASGFDNREHRSLARYVVGWRRPLNSNSADSN